MQKGSEVVFKAADGSGDLRAQIVDVARTEWGIPLYELSVADPMAETEHRRHFITWAKQGDGPGRIRAL